MTRNRISQIMAISVICLISIAFITPDFSPFSPNPAYGQAKKPRKRKNIFDLLFGKRGSLNRNNRRNSAQRVKINRKKPRRKTARTTAPRIVAVEKSEAAAKILVAGDFMAGGLAKGLRQIYADNPDIVIIDISKGLSGFVRDDVKNWPQDIGAHIDEVKPMAVVFLSGMNDRQQMRLKTGRVAKLSEPWLTAYNSRTQLLAKSVTDKKMPLIWVGLPPVRPGKMTTDYLVFNEIYRTQAESVKGIYVDIWDGFTNAEGQFVSAGPDINGQIKRLRASDGINMNNTGKRKLAFYAQKAIRKITGLGTEALLASLPGIEDARPVTPEYDPAGTGKTIVYSLANPTIDGAEILAGGATSPEIAAPEKSVSYKLVNSGEMPKTHSGRVDHYGITANEFIPIVAKKEKEDDKPKPETIANSPNPTAGPPTQ